MDEDKQMKIYNEGFMAGMEHAKPSPQTEARLTALENAVEKFIKKFEKIPETLTAIQKDIEAGKNLQKDIKGHEARITRLEIWRTGIVFVLTAGSFVAGYIINLISSNLKYQMTETAKNVVEAELQKFIISK